MKIIQYVYDVEPFELKRTNQWDSSTSVLIGTGTWQGGAINGCSTALIWIGDEMDNAEAHLTLDELKIVAGQLNELIEAMES